MYHVKLQVGHSEALHIFLLPCRLKILVMSLVYHLSHKINTHQTERQEINLLVSTLQ
jgi:hypothetical protein